MHQVGRRKQIISNTVSDSKFNDALKNSNSLSLKLTEKNPDKNLPKTQADY